MVDGPQAFPPDEARRIAERFEWHYTPKHGSWLNMVEAELSVLGRQCLARRIPDDSTLENHVSAWPDHRNKHHVKADWQFTNQQARTKLKNLYPVIQMIRSTSHLCRHIIATCSR